MGGFFGVVSRKDCISDLFFGTDYHSHLGTRRGGLAVKGRNEFTRYIHDITNAQFRSKIVLITPEGVTQLKKPGERLQICAFLWVYYGYPASCYEGINVEQVRNRCGACLARRHNVGADMVAGIPDSGTGHALGYAAATGLPYCRPFVN